MRIGILTQPLYCNYGGIVQCYALQKTLKHLGHEAIVLQREFNRKYTLGGGCIYYLKHFIKLLLGKPSSWHYYIAQEKRDFIAKNTRIFIERNITPSSRHCYTTDELRQEVEQLQLDAIVVGSDQVWRPFYSPCQPNYFLDFLANDSKVKRISYAASFGADEWTFSEELTRQCGGLLKRFDAVSVREQSGIRLCKDYFGVDAVQTLDPTLLLEQNDYSELLDMPLENTGSLFCYVLDRSPEKKNIMAKLTCATGLKPFEVMPEKEPTADNLYGDINKCVFPPVEEWLNAFQKGELILTDSFHGMVFSIIFHKPFWVVGNVGRGMARFQSLLSLFGLENRMVNNETVNQINPYQLLDWNVIDAKKAELKDKSIRFLEKALS